MTDHVAITAPTLTEPQLFSALHPELAAWFAQRFTHFSPAQRAAVPEILAGHSTLLSAPTGSGKTLAAFLGVFDSLAKLHAANALPNGIVAVYISPLRALAYDLQKNLQQPLTELGWDWLRIGSRTGDTPAKDRAAQKRRPPHILVTTPESLTLLVSQPSWTPVFRHTRFLIIDELHALAENKRGSLLMVTAERLEDLVVGPTATDTADRPTAVLRIGLSATVAPLPTVASFLVGPTRSARIVEIAQRGDRTVTDDRRTVSRVLNKNLQHSTVLRLAQFHEGVPPRDRVRVAQDIGGFQQFAKFSEPEGRHSPARSRFVIRRGRAVRSQLDFVFELAFSRLVISSRHRFRRSVFGRRRVWLGVRVFVGTSGRHGDQLRALRALDPLPTPDDADSNRRTAVADDAQLLGRTRKGSSAIQHGGLGVAFKFGRFGRSLRRARSRNRSFAFVSRLRMNCDSDQCAGGHRR